MLTQNPTTNGSRAAGTNNTNHVYIFDTTLRDGEQSPGVTLSAQEKVDIARQLSLLGVDICEAGFPAASDGDFAAVQRIAREIGPLTTNRDLGMGPMRICALARAVKSDIERACQAIRDAPKNRLHTFLATSDIHLQHKLRISRQECVKRATEAVQYALSLGANEVEFSPEDAARSDKDFLCEVLGAVIAAGATTLNIPDTVGFATPDSYGALMAYLIAHTPGADRVVWSTHCHNDLGLATANSLAGVLAGARQIEVAVNGIGERAGNTALEEVVMAMNVHASTVFPYTLSIDTRQLYRTSQLVARHTGMHVQRNKAIVGANAFAHESGIHQDGVLKHAATYEIMSPESVGVPATALVLGKHSGRAAVRARLAELGYQGIGEEQLKTIFTRFKQAADAKKNITDSDLMAIAEDEMGKVSRPAMVQLKGLQVVSGTGAISTATVELAIRSKASAAADGAQQQDQNAEEEIHTDAAISRNGPVHATFRAIERLVNEQVTVLEYEVRAVSSGSGGNGNGDALGHVVVRVARKSTPEVTFSGSATDLDVVRASALAFVDAVNSMMVAAAE
ncbi:2-isopropylmalate synthase [Catenaria anguillulae PL171]|uniref:2-isopropylmalate synthase n=1 Tax=Catenaria anguillulae PL171 TaxID=765915 RepID=A0A1Y2I2B9_9FUNG|nr:2-isopropylmalate synthase [Catenaria anguillulae PL171]